MEGFGEVCLFEDKGGGMVSWGFVWGGGGGREGGRV